ncbi:hypothetical protein OSB04_020065 [Centaurea solstitialis]|uniref:Uncharacterized protein n=1 Tax=Centaurea solstitialis TaxID=347529 RepID=A0AA38W3I2_9ASTR|nr:hypothetical protein OSB04_020065 [Centaurea solstitialis]
MNKKEYSLMREKGKIEVVSAIDTIEIMLEKSKIASNQRLGSLGRRREPLEAKKGWRGLSMRLSSNELPTGCSLYFDQQIKTRHNRKARNFALDFPTSSGIEDQLSIFTVPSRILFKKGSNMLPYLSSSLTEVSPGYATRLLMGVPAPTCQDSTPIVFRSICFKNQIIIIFGLLSKLNTLFFLNSNSILKSQPNMGIPGNCIPIPSDSQGFQQTKRALRFKRSIRHAQITDFTNHLMHLACFSRPPCSRVSSSNSIRRGDPNVDASIDDSEFVATTPGWISSRFDDDTVT